MASFLHPMAEPLIQEVSRRRRPEVHAHDHDHSGHHHHRAHSDPHSDEHGSSHHGHGKSFAIGALLNGGFVALEVVAGLHAHSMALLADASHNLSDVFGLLLSWGAFWLATKTPSSRYTYGLRSGTILAALINASLLVGAVVAIAISAVPRLFHPEAVETSTVMLVAAAGLVVNGLTAAFLAHGHHHHHGELNRRAAIIHMLGDVGISLGVLLAAAVVHYVHWLWLDPLVSLTIALVVLVSAWGTLSESFRLALQGVPHDVDSVHVTRYLAALPGVKAIHDLHIWAMSTTERAMTVHLVMPEGHPGDPFINRLANDVGTQFQIGHVTVQVETSDTASDDCPLGSQCAGLSAHGH